MPTFIKTGYWEKLQKGYKGWLNLDDLIGSSIGIGTTNFIPKYVAPNTLGNSNINATSSIITSTFTSSTSYVGQSGNTRFGFAGNTATLIFTQGLPFAIGTFSNHPLVLGTNNTENVRIFLDGNVGVGTGDNNAGYKLDVNGTARVQGGSIATQYNLSALNTAPASATATGTLGEIRIDANHIYVCTATNVWKRAAIATW
jgi:hypothetical protein